MRPPLTTPPTARQLEVLRAIADLTEAHGYAPTVRELGRRIGVKSTNAVKDTLEALARRGLLRWEQGLARTLALTESGRQRIAVLATIAGAP